MTSQVFLRALKHFKLLASFPFQLSGALEKWEQEGVFVVFRLPTSTFHGALAAQKLGHHGDPGEGGRRISGTFLSVLKFLQHHPGYGFFFYLVFVALHVFQFDD